MSLKISTIKDKYIEFLCSIDNKNIMFNKNEKRPYIGIILSIHNTDYFAPLTHPKPKHMTMKNTVDFFKLKDGKLGAINLNNMIPVVNDGISNFNLIKSSSNKYKYLLIEQQKYINRNKDILTRHAINLYNKIITGNCPQSLINRCTNFKLLERECMKYPTYLAEQEAAVALSLRKGK